MWYNIFKVEICSHSQVGKATDCKSVIVGSSPTESSKKNNIFLKTLDIWKEMWYNIFKLRKHILIKKIIKKIKKTLDIQREIWYNICIIKIKDANSKTDKTMIYKWKLKEFISNVNRH